MKFLPLILSFTITVSFISCKSKTNKEEVKKDTRPYFQGQIELETSQGLYGDLSKVYTTYYISENIIKREQKLGGINSVFDTYAGIIIDLVKDSVMLYYSDKLQSKKNKYTLSIKDYKNYLDSNNIAMSSPSAIDLTFFTAQKSKFIFQKKDSVTIQTFLCDYTLYKDTLGIVKHEVFDTKEINVKRELLELLFINIPKEVNFPLKSELKTTISDLSNDTILTGQKTKKLEGLAKRLLNGKESVDTTALSLEKIAKNKWVDLGLKVLKKGVDLNYHSTTTPTKVIKRVLTKLEKSFGLDGFVEMNSMDEFINALPQPGNFDD